MSMFQGLQFCVQLGAASLWGPEDVAKQGNTELQASKASIYGIVLELARVVLSKAFTPAANGTCVCCVVGPGVSKSPKRSTWPGMHFMEAWWKPGTHVMLSCCTTKGFKRTTRKNMQPAAPPAPAGWVFGSSIDLDAHSTKVLRWSENLRLALSSCKTCKNDSKGKTVQGSVSQLHYKIWGWCFWCNLLKTCARAEMA